MCSAVKNLTFTTIWMHTKTSSTLHYFTSKTLLQKSEVKWNFTFAFFNCSSTNTLQNFYNMHPNIGKVKFYCFTILSQCMCNHYAFTLARTQRNKPHGVISHYFIFKEQNTFIFYVRYAFISKKNIEINLAWDVSWLSFY